MAFAAGGRDQAARATTGPSARRAGRGRQGDAAQTAVNGKGGAKGGVPVITGPSRKRRGGRNNNNGAGAVATVPEGSDGEEEPQQQDAGDDAEARPGDQQQQREEEAAAARDGPAGQQGASDIVLGMLLSSARGCEVRARATLAGRSRTPRALSRTVVLASCVALRRRTRCCSRWRAPRARAGVTPRGSARSRRCAAWACTVSLCCAARASAVLLGRLHRPSPPPTRERAATCGAGLRARRLRLTGAEANLLIKLEMLEREMAAATAPPDADADEEDGAAVAAANERQQLAEHAVHAQRLLRALL